MVISLGSALAKLAAALVVPALCASRGGWRLAAWALAGSFGAFNLLWQLLARELPSPDARIRADAYTKIPDGATMKAPATKAASLVGSGPPAEPEERQPTIAEMFFAAPFQTIM